MSSDLKVAEAQIAASPPVTMAKATEPLEAEIVLVIVYFSNVTHCIGKGSYR